MKRIIYAILALFLLLISSCKNDKHEVYNPFATPEGCVKEYLAAKDSNNLARMLNCYKYEAKYETILRESLQEQIDREKRNAYDDGAYYRNDSVKLKETYPNSAVVTVYYSHIHPNDKERDWSDNYDLNLVKDSTNWKLEVRFSYSISAD